MGRGSRHWYQRDFSGGMNLVNERFGNTLYTIENGYLGADNYIIARGGKRSTGTVAAATGAQSSDPLIPLHNDKLLYISQTDNTWSVISVTNFSLTETVVDTGCKWYEGAWISMSIPDDYDASYQYANASDETLVSYNSGYILRVCGSTKTPYETGTVSGATGQATVTGSGTSWSSNVEVGQYFITYISNDPKVYRVSAVNSNTEIELDRNLDDALSGSPYIIQSISYLSVEDSTLRHAAPLNLNNVLKSGTTGAIAFHQGKLFFVDRDKPSRLRWSYTQAEASSSTDTSYKGVSRIDTASYLDVGEGVGGDINRLVSLGNELVIIKDGALFTLRGTIASDGSDLGATAEFIDGGISYKPDDMHTTALTPYGLMIGTFYGLFLYAEGRLRPFGHDRIGSNRLGTRGVSYLPNPSPRMVLGKNSDFCYEYDLEKDAWYQQQWTNSLSNPATTNESNNSYSIEDGTGKLVDWYSDRNTTTARALDADANAHPKMKLVTNRIDLGMSPALVGRPNTVYAGVYIENDATYAPTLTAEILGVTSEATGVESGQDDVIRFPIEGVRQSPMGYITLQQTAATGYMYVSSIGLDFEASHAIQPQ